MRMPSIPAGPRILATKCDRGHIFTYVKDEPAWCYYCRIDNLIAIGKLINKQRIELSKIAKEHTDELFKYLERNPNEVVTRGLLRQATEFLAMMQRHAREQDALIKDLGEKV